MTEDRIPVPRSSSAPHLNDKRISFRLRVDGTQLTATGVGFLHVCDSEEAGYQDVSISVDVWPKTAAGTVKLYRFYLSKQEVEWIRPSTLSDCEIECVDASIPKT